MNDNILIIRKYVKRALIIISAIIAVIVCMRLLNNRYKRITQTTYENRGYIKIDEENKSEVEIESDDENSEEDEFYNEDVNSLNKVTDENEIQKVSNVLSKYFTMCQQVYNGDISAKKNIIKVLTEQYVNENHVNENNVLDYICPIKNVSDINIISDECYKVEKNDVTRYYITISLSEENQIDEDFYEDFLSDAVMILNLDYKNKTFSLVGEPMYEYQLYAQEELTEIKLNEYNSIP